MKEIIYLQAGPVANFAGTHFWNIEDSYAYTEEYEDLVDHDVSFRQCLSYDNEQYYAPRALIIDNKSNIGPVTNVHTRPSTAAQSLNDKLWSGETVVSEQEPLPKSEYLTELERSSDAEPSVNDPTDQVGPVANPSKIRYWSDFTHVLYGPQTIHGIPDVGRWDRSRGAWFSGKDEFSRYDDEESLVDGSFRRLVEECDAFQGLQVMYDVAPFGSFMDSMLLSFRDEYSRNSLISFPFLSSPLPGNVDLEHAESRSMIINEALCLRNLDELAQLSIPIQSPQTWTKGTWSTGWDLDLQRPLDVSAVLATHIESSTLPLRLRGSSTDLATLTRHLNQRGSTRFSRLMGAFPMSSDHPKTSSLVYDFSTFASPMFPFRSSSAFSLGTSRIDVVRAESSSSVWYSSWKESAKLDEPLLANVRLPPCPLPTSFPPLLPDNLIASSPPLPTHSGRPLRSASVLSSLASDSAVATLFAFYAKSVQTCIRKKKDLSALGLDGDEIRELDNDLWTLHDNCAVDEEGSGGEDVLGEDE